MVDLVSGERRLGALQVRVARGAPDDAVTIIDGLNAAPANIFASGETVTLEKHLSPEEAGLEGVVG
jgi:hypothetical protein